MAHEETLELRWFFAVIRRWAWLIAGCTLLALAVAFFVTSRMPPTYEATATLLVAPVEQANTSEYTSLMAGERLALTYTQMLKGRSVLETTVARLGLDVTPEALAQNVQTVTIKDTQLVRVTVRDTSPVYAALIANTIGEAFIEHAKVLQEDRYRADLLGKEANIEAQSKLIEEAQAQFDATRAKKVFDETELARLQDLLADYRATNRTLQLEAVLENPDSGRLANMQAEIARLSTLIDQTQAEVQARNTAYFQSEAELARLEAMLAEYRSDYRMLQQSYEQVRLTASQVPGTVVITELAHEPKQTAGNNMLYIVLAAIVAMSVALGAACFIEYLDDSIRTPEDVSHALGLGTLGLIGQFDAEQEKPIIAARPHSVTAEAFRVLATNVRLASMDSHLRTIVVTSPAPEDGKSAVTANLAIAMAGAGLRVLVVDADLRSPRQATLFGVNRDQGLTDALWQGDTDCYSRSIEVEGVRVLASGKLPLDPVGVISSPRMKKLLDNLAQQADLVIVDSPPVLAVADTTILAAGADGVLLVVRAGRTGRQPARRAVEALRQARTPVLGVVLNGAADQSERYYRYYGASEEEKVAGSGQNELPRMLSWSLPYVKGGRRAQRDGSFRLFHRLRS